MGHKYAELPTHIAHGREIFSHTPFFESILNLFLKFPLQILLWLTIIMSAMVTSSYGQAKPGLRRKPKIYNALITTDENLVQSRAYPVIQPTIHESGIAHYPFGPYGPYGGFYNPHLVRFAQPIAPNFTPKEQVWNNINFINTN